MNRTIMTKQTLVFRFLLIVCIGSLLASCGQSNNVVSHRLIQKRKHNKGWFIKWGGGSGSNDQANKGETKDEESFEAEIRDSKRKDNSKTKDYKIKEERLPKTDESAFFEEEKIDSKGSSEELAMNSESMDLKGRKNLKVESESDESMSFAKIQFPGNPFLPQFRPYDSMFHPLMVIILSGLLAVLLVLWLVFLPEVIPALIMLAICGLLAGFALFNYVRVVAGTISYGVGSDLELAALIIGGVLGIGGIAYLIYAIFNLL